MDPKIRRRKTGLISAVVFVTLAMQHWAKGDTCANAIELGNFRRSSNYELKFTEVPLCDKYTIPGTGLSWFRFSNSPGGKIQERIVGDDIDIYRCGTDFPIWIKGIQQHPTVVNSETTAVVCSNFGKGCAWEGQIKIRKCEGDFFVYQLAPVPSCSMAYCTGTSLQCPSNETYSQSLGKCIGIFPIMTSLPTLSEPTVLNRTHFVFNCHIGYLGTESQAMFRVTFLFDGEKLNASKDIKDMEDVPVFDVTATEGKAVLLSHYLLGRLGKRLSCMVQSYWNSSRSNLSDALDSSTKWLGIKFEVDQVELTDINYNKKVAYYSTIPVQRDEPFRPIVHMYLISNAGYPQTDQCGYRVGKDDWTGSEMRNNNSFVDFRTVPYRSNIDRTWTNIFNIDVVSSIWIDYDVKLQVIYKTKASRYCSAVTDPHYKTFDDRRTHCFTFGDFYLWRSYSPRIFEVQAQHWGWSNNPSRPGTMCGVAVREGNHILGINMCRSPQDPSTAVYPYRLIEYLVDESSPKGVIIDMGGNKRTIIMPSGAKVDVYLFHNYMNVYVYGIDEDRDNSTGLCGNYNGRVDDDLYFSAPYYNCSVYKVDAEDSFFNENHPPTCKNVSSVPAPNCLCGNKNEDLTLWCNSTTLPTVRTYYPCGGTPIRGRRRRSAQDQYDDLVFDLDEIYNDPMEEPPNRPGLSWPTPSGITEVKARAACEQGLAASPVYNECKTLVKMEDLVDDCVIDIQAGDNLDFIADLTSVLEVECVHNAKAQITIGSTDTDMYNQQMNLLYQITDKVCPNHCSKHGTCAKGACICDSSFSGDDCSLKEGDPPEILYLWGKGLCDTQSKPCRVAHLSVNGIDNKKAIFCIFQRKGAGHRVIQTTGVAPSGSDVSCPMPELYGPVTARTYRISIKNGHNGRVSQSKKLVVYDSNCMSCQTDLTCTEKTDACLIDGACHLSGDRNGNSFCETCDTSKDRHSWTEITDSPNPGTGSCEWTQWTTCSRSCDTGVFQRRMRCGNVPVCPESSETLEQVLCHQPVCSTSEVEEKEQDDHAITMKVDKEDIPRVLAKLENGFEAIAAAVNEYCSDNPHICCSVEGITVREDVTTDMIITDHHLCKMAAGYPTLTVETAIMKLLVKYRVSSMKKSCNAIASNRRRKRSSDEEYLIPKIVKDAMLEKKEQIERAFGATLTPVEETEPGATSGKWLYYVLGAVGGLLGLAAVIIAVCICKKKSAQKAKEENNYTERSESVGSLNKVGVAAQVRPGTASSVRMDFPGLDTDDPPVVSSRPATGHAWPLTGIN